MPFIHNDEVWRAEFAAASVWKDTVETTALSDYLNLKKWMETWSNVAIQFLLSI